VIHVWFQKAEGSTTVQQMQGMHFLQHEAQVFQALAIPKDP